MLGIGIGIPLTPILGGGFIRTYPLPTNGFNVISTLSPKVWLAADYWQTKCYIDSAMTTLVTKDQDPIGAWKDLTSNNFSPIQATSLKRPSLSIAHTTLGLPGIQFNGTSSFLQCAFGSNFSQPNTVFVVATMNAGAAQCFFDGASSAHEMGVFYTTANNMYMYAGGSILRDTSFTPPVTSVFTYLFNGASSIMRIDGTQVASGTNPGTNSCDGLSLGGSFSGGDPLNGYIHEVIFVNASVTGTNQTNTEGYLKNKWGIT